MPYADTNGARLSYESLGEGVPLLFIHGGYGGAASTLSATRAPHAIRDVLPRDKVRTIIYDRRNAGASSYGFEHCTLSTFAADALGLLDHLGEKRAIILGASAGGPIAQQLALAAPERVIALCLPNTGAHLAALSRSQGKSRAALVANSYARGDRAVFGERKEALRTPALANASEEDLFRCSVGEVRNYEAYLNVDFTPRLAELKMPTLIIHGTADQTVPYEWGVALHKGIAGSEFVSIEGGVHGIVSNPEAKKAIHDWVLRVIG